jgi:TM2 domain-containing membrane protein YozV
VDSTLAFKEVGNTERVYPPKMASTAYALMLFSLIGVCGIQHFYMGKVGRGVLWLLTGGLLGVGLIIDLFTLPSQVRNVNAHRAVGIA